MARGKWGNNNYPIMKGIKLSEDQAKKWHVSNIREFLDCNGPSYIKDLETIIKAFTDIFLKRDDINFEFISKHQEIINKIYLGDK